MTPAPIETQNGDTYAPVKKIRRKSPKACLYCRGRKIRCDVSHCNGPCTNCHLDNEKCIVAAKASRK
ncbi:fungal specific transcription factor [Ilyonectria robusta]